MDAVQDKTQLAPFTAALKTVLDGDKADGTKSNAAKSLPGMDEVTAESTQLYNELEQADANPTAALLTAAAHVQQEGKEVLPGWDNFKQTQIPGIDHQLQLQHHPAIQLSQVPTNIPQEGDED
jgi:hypothetical protein